MTSSGFRKESVLGEINLKIMKKVRNFFRPERGGMAESLGAIETGENNCIYSNSKMIELKNDEKKNSPDTFRRKFRRTFSSIHLKFRRNVEFCSNSSKNNCSALTSIGGSAGMKSRQSVYRSKSQVRPLERSSYTGSTSSATHYEDVDENSVSDIRRSSQLSISAAQGSNKHSSKSIGEELRALAQYGWYWGPISRTETQNRLASKADGSFLVRDSCSDYHLLTLSYRCNGLTFHTRTAFFGGFYSLFPLSETSDLFPSIVELIKFAIERSKRGVLCYVNHGREVVAVRLLTPISRFDHVRSLQSLCRFVIRQNIRWDYIDKLPVPPSLKVYLEENYLA